MLTKSQYKRDIKYKIIRMDALRRFTIEPELISFVIKQYRDKPYFLDDVYRD